MKIEEFYRHFKQLDQRFTTDTRKLQSGDIFFALKGGNFNGNRYAKQALESGAALVVTDEDTDSDPGKTVRVDDVLTFMQQLATYHRNQFNIPVLAVAGSNGKTTTKELLISVLSEKYRVHATSGNLNNHIGVPMTLLSMAPDTEIAVIEIGTNAFGEIRFLSELLQPDFGLITNIGKEHLEGFGDLEGVAREESELYHYLLRNKGFAFVNLDDPYLSRMSHRLTNKSTYSVKTPDANVYVEILQPAPTLELRSGESLFTSVLGGFHNAQNIASVIAVARHFGLSETEIQNGLAAYQPSNNRSEIKTIGSNRFYLDAYNANPSSMEAALETFNAIDSDHKIVLLGDMFELGDTALEEHQAIAQKALSLPGCQVFLTGKTFTEAAKNLDVMCFENVDDLSSFLRDQDYKSTWFLIKGSRGMKMEKVLDAFTSEPA